MLVNVEIVEGNGRGFLGMCLLWEDVGRRILSLRRRRMNQLGARNRRGGVIGGLHPYY
jgi:hypothetical protein